MMVGGQSNFLLEQICLQMWTVYLQVWSGILLPFCSRVAGNSEKMQYTVWDVCPGSPGNSRFFSQTFPEFCKKSWTTKTHPTNPSTWKNGMFFHENLLLQNRPTSSSWWFQPLWNILVKLGNLPQVGVKIKNIWNHHLDENLILQNRPTSFVASIFNHTTCEAEVLMPGARRQMSKSPGSPDPPGGVAATKLPFIMRYPLYWFGSWLDTFYRLISMVFFLVPVKGGSI